jgi:hypothetical protein
METSTTLYEKDFFAWTQEQARLIKAKAFSKLDLTNLFEEIESMGKHEKRELASRIEVLLLHLLKWKFQPNYEYKNSWKYTIKEQRKKISYHLEDNPSLRNPEQLNLAYTRAYESAIYETIKETGLAEKTFPKQCEWTIEEVLNDDFFPS